MSAYTSLNAAYTEASVLTAPPERLIVLLYDGALRFLRQASVAMRAGDAVRCRDRLRRADAIITELNVSLDMSCGEIPVRLRSIYLFCRRCLTGASVARDADAIDRVAELLAELRESWQTIADGAAAQPAA
jgi:flagellar protein FliS